MAEKKKHYSYPVINEFLNAYRAEHGLTAEEMAAELGMAKSTFYSKVNGYASWTINDLVILAQKSGISYKELIEGRTEVEHERWGSKPE